MRSRKMDQRTWIITGVNSGFGRHMTEQLLARGDRVAGTVRKMDAMNDLKAKYSDLPWLAHLDVTDTPAIHQVVTKPSPSSARSTSWSTTPATVSLARP